MVAPALLAASLLVHLVVADEPLVADVRQAAEKLMLRVEVRKEAEQV